MLLDAFHRVGKPTRRIEAIHTANHLNVTQTVRDYPKTCRDDRIVVFVTHAALQLTDLSAYSDWVLIIDEVPSVWFNDSLKTPATWTLFRDNFTLLTGGQVPGVQSLHGIRSARHLGRGISEVTA